MTEVFVGDTMPIVVSWFVPSPNNPYQEQDATISSAEVTVIRNKDRAMVVEAEDATISGNETIYTVPSERMTRTGLHTAYVSALFNDGTRLTQELSFYVKSM